MNETSSKRQRQDATTGGSSCLASQQQRRRRRPRDADDGSIHLAVKDEKEDESNKGKVDSNKDKVNDDHDESSNSNSSMIPIRDCTRLYCSAATLHCARQQHCIPCAYKIACFDVALDTSFCRAIPNQRPEACPRTTTTTFSLSSANNTNNNNPAEQRRVGDVAAEMGTLGYQPHYRILTIGDGDFSFSLALAFMLQQEKAKNQDNVASRKANSSSSAAAAAAASGGLTATSFESKETLEKVYGPEMMKRIHLLESMGVCILYQIDGTKLTPELFSTQQQPGSNQQPSSSSSLRFHRIVWNFPCSAIQKGQDGQNQEMEYNKTLIRDFVAGAVPLLHPDNGQIHINHKTKPPFNQWQIQDVALTASSSSSGDKTSSSDHQRNDVYYWGRVVLDRALFPPYVPRKALHSKSFPVHDACTYIFGHTAANQSNANTGRGLDADVVNLDLDDYDDDATHDDMTLSASALVAVTRPLILSLRRHLLQSILPSQNKNQTSKSNRNRKKLRTH